MANPFRGTQLSYLNQILCNSFVECGVSTTPVLSEPIELPTNMPDWGDIDLFCNQYGFYQENPIEALLHKPENQETVRNGFEEGIVSCSDAKNVGDHEIPQLPHSPKMTIEHTLFPDGWALVRNFQKKQFKGVGGANLRNEDTGHHNISPECQKLSTDQILKVAGERFLELSSQKVININMIIYDYGSSFSGLSFEDNQDVKLVQLLLAAAEKVSQQQFEMGIRLLRSCQWIASREGTPVQRAVFYFSEALRERIGKETESSEKEEEKNTDACLSRNILALLAMHQELPFFQVLHFSAVQTVLEHVRMKSKVHIIDFQIMTGVHWAALMQAIAQQAKTDSQGHLKITAVEMFDRHGLEQTGKLLTSFARYLNLPFSFKVVFVPDINDLSEDDLGIDPNNEEAVAVHFPFILRTLISKPNCLKNLMTITQKIKPLVMVVCEAETNHNSPSFVNRFIEALFFYGALFDSLEESMSWDDKNRMTIETGAFGEGIRNIVSREGCERVTRSVSINVWRAFFARFGMVEMELTSASIYQASLIVKKFPCGRYCSLDVSSKCLIVEWKGTPLFSLSAWKFN